ncbi:KIF4 [Mytilus coruscus]|uniref:KIF4 n=1 Tax=Mytilus coruscus TaxID=42192 RepID=A0A6J8DW60_MYTCO|nr:KIF4 [Mytilus coruscus]
MRTFSSAALSKLVHYLPHRAKVLTNLKKELSFNKPDLHKTAVTRTTFEEENILLYIQNLRKSHLVQFEHKTLSHFFNNKIILTKLQKDDLLSYENVATTHLMTYIKSCMTDFKFRYNKTRKITGFSFKPQTVSYVKKELKDQRLENSLLRKQISWSKNQNIPVSDFQQFIALPKAIVDSDGLPYKDNDTYNIGLPFIQTLDKQVFVQLTFKKDVIYLNMNKLVHSMKNDQDLQCLSNDNHDNIPLIFQMLYIVTGCDYVSFFRDHGKTSFYQIFFKYPDFITSNNIVKGWLGILSDSDNTENAGFLAFLRLVGCEYWRKCSSAFLKDRIESPHYLFQSVFVETLSPLENHFIWLSKIRDALYCRVPSEEFFLPLNDALFLHWKRSCWVKLVWQQANQNFVHYPILNDHGWKIEKNVLSIVWDSNENLEKISNNIKLWTAGCGCLKSNCSGNQCGCRKQRKSCGPGCKCGQSCLNSNGPTMLPSGDANIQQPNEKTQVEHLYDSESDTDSDNMTFNDFFLEFENLGINLVELDESDLQTVITDFNTHV